MNASQAPILALMAEQAGERTAWVHLIPTGTFSGIDGRGPYLMNDPVAVMKATREYTGKRKIVIDYEHQSMKGESIGLPAPAAGWIVGLETRDDGIWGLVEWTDKAAAHITSKEYRYISPVFKHTNEGAVLFLLNAALTNSPNLDQLTALNRAEATTMNENLTAKLKAVAKLLGLPETASQDEILAKVQEIAALAGDLAELTGDPSFSANTAKPDPTKFVPIGDFERVVAEGNKLRHGISQHAAEEHVLSHINKGNLAPYLREWGISLCMTNKGHFDSFMSRVGPHFSALTTPTNLGQYPSGKADKSGLLADELAVCANMGLTPEQFTKARA